MTSNAGLDLRFLAARLGTSDETIIRAFEIMPSRPTVKHEGLQFRVTPKRFLTQWNRFYVECWHPTFRVEVTRVGDDVSAWEEGITFTIGVPGMPPGQGRVIGTAELSRLDLPNPDSRDWFTLSNVDVAQPGQATVYVVFPGGGGRSVFSYNVFTVGSMVLAIVGAGLIILSNWAIQSCTSGDTTIIVR